MTRARCGPCTSMPPAARCSRALLPDDSCAYWSSRTKQALRESAEDASRASLASRSTWRATARRACSPGSSIRSTSRSWTWDCPKLPGLEVIRRLRAGGKSYPILVLTARDNWQDKVEGLQAGADDYVAKPFHFEEVLARVQALLRRAGGWATAAAALRADRARYARPDRAGERAAGGAHHLRVPHPRAPDAAGRAMSSPRPNSPSASTIRTSSATATSSRCWSGACGASSTRTDELQPIETLRGRGYRFALARDAGG